jgi:hypothetical protein
MKPRFTANGVYWGIHFCGIIGEMSYTEEIKLMARKTMIQRNEEQRLRQLKTRQTAKDLRRPSRDDLARMLLWQMITGIQNNKNADKKSDLNNLCNKIVGGLVQQGFCERESEDIFDALVRKYVSGLSPFRRKAHLKSDVTISE